MATCPKCGFNNAPNAKFCGSCGAPSMAAGVGYQDAPRPVQVGSPAPQGGMLPTVPEVGGGAPMQPMGIGHGDARVGGAASTVQEDYPGGVPPRPGMGPLQGGAPKTQLHEEAAKPIAGWLVVLRSRSMRPYQDIPIFVGRNMLGRNPGLGPHYVEDGNASAEHAMVLTNDAGVEIMDLGSGNGTTVNNQKIRSCALNKGDMVRIGKTVMVFVSFPGETQQAQGPPSTGPHTVTYE